MGMLTNGLLLGLMLLVLLWVGVAAAFGPFDNAQEILAYFGFIAATGLLGAGIVGIVGARPRGTGSIWSKASSPRVVAVLFNAVVSAFLCGLAILTLLILQAKRSAATLTGAILALLAGLVFGRYLQKRFSSRSLLPYGLSFLAAFAVMLIAFVAMGVRG